MLNRTVLDQILEKTESHLDLGADSDGFSILHGRLKAPILNNLHCQRRKAVKVAFNTRCRAYAALLVDYGVKLKATLLVGFARFIGILRGWTVDTLRFAYAQIFEYGDHGISCIHEARHNNIGVESPSRELIDEASHLLGQR